jgi:hypothetical protein
MKVISDSPTEGKKLYRELLMAKGLNADEIVAGTLPRGLSKDDLDLGLMSLNLTPDDLDQWAEEYQTAGDDKSNTRFGKLMDTLGFAPQYTVGTPTGTSTQDTVRVIYQMQKRLQGRPTGTN